MLVSVDEIVCANCEHRFVYHGDRAITACDGGYMGTQNTRVRSEPGKAYCKCPGWVAGRLAWFPKGVPD